MYLVFRELQIQQIVADIFLISLNMGIKGEKVNAYPWGGTVKWKQRKCGTHPLESRVNPHGAVEPQSLVLWPSLVTACTPPQSQLSSNRMMAAPTR